jgi:hypothetical protein
MIAKREAEETLVPDGIEEDEIRITRSKRRRIVICIDDDDDDDDGVKTEESVEKVQPPVMTMFQEEKPPNTDIDDHDDQAMQIEADVTPIQPKRRRVITRANGEETSKGEQSTGRTEQPQTVPMSDTQKQSRAKKAAKKAIYKRLGIGGFRREPLVNTNNVRAIVTVNRGTEITESQLHFCMVLKGIFRAQTIHETDPETGTFLRVINDPPEKRYDCLYCRLHGAVVGYAKLSDAEEHREECRYKPKVPDPIVHERGPTSATYTRPARIVLHTPHWTSYAVRLNTKKWTCRECQGHREPEKYWTSQGWVRRHWLSCAYNPNIGGYVPPVRRKRKTNGGNGWLFPH